MGLDDPLARMHLLLREHGWEPEYRRGHYGDEWVWTRPGVELVFLTDVKAWSEYSKVEWYGGLGPGDMGDTVDSLRLRLEELTKK